MEENNQSEQTNNTEEVKATKEQTVNSAQNTAKKPSQSTNDMKELFVGLFKNPIAQIEKVANARKNQFLMFAIIAFVIWVIASLLREVIGVFTNSSLLTGYFFSTSTLVKSIFSSIISVVSGLLTPVISVALLSLLIYVFKKGEKKPFMNVVASVLVAKLPVIVASILQIFESVTIYAYKLTTPLAGFCGVLSTVLTFFTIKSLYGEKEDNSVMKSFVIIMAIYYGAKFVLSFLGISI